MKKLLFLTLCLFTVTQTKQEECVEIQKNQAHIIAPEISEKSEKQIAVRYKNYRGEVAVRTIIPLEGGLYWGKTEYHPHNQWLLKVWDVEKNAERIYALCDIQEFLK